MVEAAAFDSNSAHYSWVEALVCPGFCFLGVAHNSPPKSIQILSGENRVMGVDGLTSAARVTYDQRKTIWPRIS